MPPKDNELERYEQTEAQDLIRLFEAVKPTNEIQAPPDFRVKVLTKIEQQRARHGFLTAGTYMFAPAWAPVLAAVLLLSLGVNAWLGIWVLGQREPGDGLAVGSRHEIVLDSHAFQASITSDADLGALASAHSVIGKQATTFGFAARPERTRYFIIGTLYAEALAYIHSGDMDTAVQRLQVITNAVNMSQLPAFLATYLDLLPDLLKSNGNNPEMVGRFVSLFEPLYSVYTRDRGTEQLTLFQAGAWLEDMSLAAAAGDQAALRQEATVQYFATALRRLNAPKGVLNALEQLSPLVGQQEMSKQDIAKIHKLVKKTQGLLG